MRLRLLGTFEFCRPSRLKDSDASRNPGKPPKVAFRENILHGLLATFACPGESKPFSGRGVSCMTLVINAVKRSGGWMADCTAIMPGYSNELDTWRRFNHFTAEHRPELCPGNFLQRVATEF